MRRRRTAPKKSRKARLLALAVATLICCTGFAFTAAIVNVNASSAGDGAGAVNNNNASSFVVGTLQYTLNSNDPRYIQSVDITFSTGTPSSVSAVVGAGSWSVCTSSGGTWTCTFSPMPIISAVNLRVVATS
jgi:hypothetical protein